MRRWLGYGWVGWVALSAVFTISTAQAQVGVTIYPPGTGSTGSTTVTVGASITSLYAVTSATAVIGTHSAPLTKNGDAYVGVIDLGNEPRGTKTVTVTATDAYNTQGSASLEFLLDRGPVLNVTSPVAGDVARPSLPIAATCTDDATGCVIRLVSYKEWPAGASVSESLSFANRDGETFLLQFEATDSEGQMTTLTRSIVVDQSPTLELVATAATAEDLLDFDGTRSLLRGAGSAIVRTHAGQETTIYNTPGSTISAGSLFPGGAALITSTGGWYWNGSTLAALDADALSRAAGNYLAYRKGAHVTLRNVTNGQDVFTTTPFATDSYYAIREFLPTAGGTLVWSDTWPGSNRLWRWRSGTTAHEYPQNVASGRWWGNLKADEVHITGSVAGYGGANSVRLIDDGDQESYLCSSNFDAACFGAFVANGWVAYSTPESRTNPTDGAKAHRITPANLDQTVSAFQASTVAEGINPSGTVAMRSGKRRYLTNPAGAPFDISTSQGWVTWKDDWFVSLGRSLFRAHTEPFTPPADAGVDSGPSDAGAPTDTDGGVDAASDVDATADVDAGSLIDAGDDQDDAGGQDAGLDSAANNDADTDPESGGGGGSDCSLRAAPSGSNVALFLALPLLVVLGRRRARRRS